MTTSSKAEASESSSAFAVYKDSQLRVAVYVDGFNLYYRGLRKTSYKWVNLQLLSEALLSKNDKITSIKYFTADVSPKSGDPEAPVRQQTYLRALRTIPNLTIHHGRFLSKTKTRPLVSDPNTYVEVHDTEEKGSDVNLASHLLKDAFENHFDAALVFSQDTDLCEPIRVVFEDLKKVVGVVWMDGSNPGKRHRKITSFIRHANPSVINRCQFPETVIGRGGMKIQRPKGWGAQ